MLTPEIGRSASGNECSWCCAEFKVAPTPNVSHGICQRHADEMIARTAARRLEERRDARV